MRRWPADPRTGAEDFQREINRLAAQIAVNHEKLGEEKLGNFTVGPTKTFTRDEIKEMFGFDPGPMEPSSVFVVSEVDVEKWVITLTPEPPAPDFAVLKQKVLASRYAPCELSYSMYHRVKSGQMRCPRCGVRGKKHG